VVVGGAILILGFALQMAIVWIANHWSKRWHPLLQMVFVRVRALVRWAVLLVAVGTALPLLPLSAEVLDATRPPLVAGFILLLGYAIHLGADIAIARYMESLRLDVADNLLARKAATQLRVLRRIINVLIFLITAGLALMSFSSVRQFGISLFASAGVAGLAVGLAARPLLSNLIAGIQIALAQPIKLDDVVVVDGEWGRIEEFTATYVVVRLWDLRRLIVPLSYFLEQPFRNWTYTSSQILGQVHLYADYTLPIQPVREKCLELIKASPLWDGGVAVLQVVGADANVIQLRALMSSADGSKSWDLRCAVREQLIEFIQQNFPYALPKTRADLTMPQEQGGKDRPCPSGPATGGAADGGHGRARGESLSGITSALRQARAKGMASAAPAPLSDPSDWAGGG
jgi:small-conductance mechanosensitive channel